MAQVVQQPALGMGGQPIQAQPMMVQAQPMMVQAQPMMQVQVPAGMAPGALFMVMTPQGQQMQVSVPQGASPGMMFQVALPAMMQPGMVPMSGAPMMMQRGIGALAPFNNLFVRQTRKGCIQEMMGCEANNEFLISTMENQNQTLFYALEESSTCMRLICKAQRTSKMTVITGDKPGGSGGTDEQFQAEKMQKLVMAYDRPFRCMMQPCKLCCHQEMNFTDEKWMADGSLAPNMGSMKEDIWCFVPHMSIYDETGAKKYVISNPTCCGGMCVDICAEGCCNMKIPYYIYGGGEGQYKAGLQLSGTGAASNEKSKHPQTGMKNAQITKIWGGFTTELFSDADKFEVEFPVGATPRDKGRLLGAVFFLNMNFFERQKDDASAAV